MSTKFKEVSSEELDYMLYQQEYDASLKVEWKPRSEATAPGHITHNDHPLDFSFLKL